MPRTGQYLFGLVMFCLAFVFTMGLGSFIQNVALIHQQQQVAQAPGQFDMPLVSVLPPTEFRKTSF